MSLDVSLVDIKPVEVFKANITHNLRVMAMEAGIYQHLWRPEELNITKASELINPLTHGLDLLRADPDRFRQYEPESKWGTYESLVSLVSNYLHACRLSPNAVVTVSR